MRLISGHIENFGVLENLDLDFRNGLNTYYQENGVGKTTLAAFIKAMFYGFDNKLNKDFPERYHYYPFKGGNINYGGSLTFETKGQIYKIEATFDYKSNRKDNVVVRDSKGQVIALDKNPGEYFFDIDLPSFSRTLFVSANDLLIESTDSINRKLGGFVNNIDETKLNKRLADKIKELESTRKNSEGIIARYDIEINDLEQKIVETNKLANLLPEKYASYEQTKAEIDNWNLKKDAKKNQEILKAKYETITKLKEDIAKNEADKEAIDSKYGDGLPTTEELMVLKNLSVSDSMLMAQIENSRMSSIEEELWVNFKEKYKDSTFSSSEIANLRKELANQKQAKKRKETLMFSEADTYELEQLATFLKEIKIEEVEEYEVKVTDWLAEDIILAKKSSYETPNITHLKNTYSLDKPSTQELEQVASKIKLYDENCQKIEAYNTTFYNTPLKPEHEKTLLPLVLTTLGGTLTLAGLVLLVVMLTLGIVVASLGGVSLIFGLALWLSKSHGIASVNLDSRMQKEIVNLQSTKNVLANELRSFFAKYRLATDNFAANLERIKLDLVALSEYEEEQKILAVSRSQHLERQQEIRAYYQRYACDGEDMSKLPKLLKAQLQRFTTLKERKKLYEINQKQEDDLIDESNKEIKAIFQSHNMIIPDGFDDEFIDVLESEANRYSSLKKKKDEYERCSLDLTKNTNLINQILGQYNLTKSNDFSNQYLTLNADRIDYDKLVATISKDRESLVRYQEKNDLRSYQPEILEVVSEEVIAEEIHKLNVNLSVLDTEIKEIEELINQVDDLKADIYRIKESQNKSVQRLKNLKILQECFFEAEANLKDKYIGPMELSFVKYAKKINDKLAINVKMDYNFEIKYDIYGKEREYKHLSEGQKACLALCMRFAMIENMYKGEKLFIILDDPFVNLDEKNIAKCLSVLKELALENQILYFTCHNSRVE